MVKTRNNLLAILQCGSQDGHFSSSHEQLSADERWLENVFWNYFDVSSAVLSCSFVSDSLAALWTVARQAPLSMRSSRQILEWVAISYSRGSSWLRDQTHVSCTVRQIFLPLAPATWEALMCLARIIFTCKIGSFFCYERRGMLFFNSIKLEYQP